MSRRARLLAAAVIAAVAFAGAPAHAGTPVQFAGAVVALEGPDARYFVAFTVRRGFKASAHTELVVEVSRCAPDCVNAAASVDPLPDAAFVVTPSLGARLRTTWLGRPLRIDWAGAGEAMGRADTGRAYTVVGASHEDVLVDYRLAPRTAAATVLGARTPCRDRLGDVIEARIGMSEDVRAKQLPRPETVPGLTATKGRCYY